MKIGRFCSFSSCSGMTLLSMCMNLMQEQIVEKVSWIAQELGMKGDGNDEEIVKISKEVQQSNTKGVKYYLTYNFSGQSEHDTSGQGWQC